MVVICDKIFSIGQQIGDSEDCIGQNDLRKKMHFLHVYRWFKQLIRRVFIYKYVKC